MAPRCAPSCAAVRSGWWCGFATTAAWPRRIFRALRSQPSDQWPTLAAIARTRGLGEQVLRRQLAKEGFTYQEIKHEVRRALVFNLLRDRQLSISEIAVRAGFQEPSAFHRLFRRWTGQSPGQFRSQLHPPPRS
ncbi:AraC family transcriptional regulator OS=Stutzerimonas stutzeri OX=316 GN=CXK95_14935 PE=4 SV=1 [Stutzerimonas stutzeri]